MREVNSRRDAHVHEFYDGTQNLSHEEHVTQHQKCDKVRACVHAQVLCILRVFMFMSLYLLLMWFVSCLSSVLVSSFMLYLYCFRSQFSVVGGILFTHPVGDSKLRWLLPNFATNFCTKFVVRLIPQVNRPYIVFAGSPAPSVLSPSSR